MARYHPPRATVDYVQLRFQLARFQVHRIVQLPITFTFENLHTLIQYMFGWSDAHLHHAEVFPNAVLYDEEALKGTIKSCGRKRPLEDYELGDEGAIDDWNRFEPADKPIYRVQPRVTQRKDIDLTMVMEEKGVTLQSIWTPNEATNISDGQCPNARIAIIYTYDLGAEWTVHVTCEQGSIFFRSDAPSNLPIFKDARGAPPIEDTEWDAYLSTEDDPEDKTVSPRLFDVSYFQGYCEGKVTSEARKTKLDILTLEEAQVKHREYLERVKEKEDRINNGECDEDDEFDNSEDEYFRDDE